MAFPIDDRIQLLSASEANEDDTFYRTEPYDKTQLKHTIINFDDMEEDEILTKKNENVDHTSTLNQGFDSSPTVSNGIHNTLIPSAPVLDLPKEKKYHLFIVSASEDRDKVIQLIEELENNFGITCLFSDRDFNPGLLIRQNIMFGMKYSMKSLLFLTPHFFESHYCQMEVEIAMHMALESGINCMIPILAEDCETPFLLKPRTYINATHPGMTVKKVATLIREALPKTGRFITCMVHAFT